MDTDAIRAALKRFDTDTAAVMREIPPKKSVKTQLTLFGEQEIQDGSFVAKKKSFRDRFQASSDGGQNPGGDELLEEPGKNDRAEALVDQLRYTTVEQIDQAGLGRAALPEVPWSDDYWPIYRGILGCRYSDPNFPGRDSQWQDCNKYIEAHPLARIVESGAADAIDQLSPSEKYDLLVGDTGTTLTRSMWLEGKGYLDSHGSVETWMGICHGWAPASFMLPDPRRIVTAVSPDGVAIRFFPADIKALASLLWANAAPPMRFIGSRADEKNPAMDAEGRITSKPLRDTNPGTWHLAVVNQIAGKRSFVLDAQFDYEVWNQPVYSYEYTYFNPQESRPASDLRDGVVARAAFTNDKFAKYRSDKMTSVVGVAMNVGYVVESSPGHAADDSPSTEHVNVVQYLYDLELDAKGTIVGGEWLQQAHPDFLWTPPLTAKARTQADKYAVGSWSVAQPLPNSWQNAAHLASQYQQPLANIVHSLITAARD